VLKAIERYERMTKIPKFAKEYEIKMGHVAPILPHLPRGILKGGLCGCQPANYCLCTCLVYKVMRLWWWDPNM